MSRLFDEAELKEWVENWFYQNKYYHPYSKSKNIPCDELYDILERMPTIDAVEVVRCGECGLRYKPLDDDVRNEIYCTFIGSTMRKDDFCSYGCADGERKDDADNR